MSYRGGNNNSQATYKRMLNDIRSNNPSVKLSSLESIAETIAFSDPLTLRNFPIQEACKEFVKIIQHSNDMQILALSSQCIVNLLDSCPESAKHLMNFNYIQIVKEKMDYEISKNVIENLVHSLCALTKTKAKAVGQVFGIKFILKNLDAMNGAERHYAVSSLSNFTSYFCTPKFGASLPTIAGYFSSNDDQIVSNMITTFTNIMNSVNFSDIPIETIETLCVSLSIINNSKTIIQILELLLYLILSQPFAEMVIDVGLNYEGLLTNTDYGLDLPKIRLLTNQIIRLLLPTPDFPSGFWVSERQPLDNSLKLANSIKPLFIKLSLEKTTDLDYVYSNLAMILTLTDCVIPSQLYPSLISTSQDVKLAPFVLLLALNLPDKSLVNSSGLTSHLCKIKLEPKPKESIQIDENELPKTIGQWYRQKCFELKKMTGMNRTKSSKPSSFKTFKKIFDFINETQLSAFELNTNGYIDRFLELMRNEIPNVAQYDFSRIVDIIHQILAYSPLNQAVDPFESFTSLDFANGSLFVDVKCDNKTYKIKKFENESLFVAIEAWYNEMVNNITTNDMLEAARHSGRLGHVVSLEHAHNNTYTHIGILHRAFNTKKYQKFTFKLNNKKFSACDFLYQSIARTIPSTSNFRDYVPTIELIREDSSEFINNKDWAMTSLEVPRNNVPNKVALEILQLIHKFIPDLDLYSVEFEKALFGHLMSFYLDISLNSVAVQVAVNYPFLFSFEFKSFVARLVACDFFSALSFAHSSIFNSTEKLRAGRVFNHCNVSRSSLFDDGVMLMSSLGKSPLQLDISFEGEAGFGVGPTKEFYSQLALEFTRINTRMWRNDLSNTEFAWTKIGLFPKYGAKPRHFFALGVLCAKTVAMNSVLPIPFSVEFFKFIKGEKLTMEEVDETYANSLKNKEGLIGLNFVYPGNDSLELIKNGKNTLVTQQNVDSYVNFVNDYMIGSKLDSLKNAFCDGFATVFQKGIWDMFDARELRTLIAGEDVRLSLIDLKNYVEISHGYEPSSPQIAMLFDILLEFDDQQKSLFIKFITGSERLPIGGLSSLQPHLSVAKKSDDSLSNQDDALPSVMTCTHYFKLPPYSSKEIMKNKILLAIFEGQGAFLLT